MDEKLARLDALLSALRFADGADTRDLERARLLVAELRLEVNYLRERLGASDA